MEAFLNGLGYFLSCSRNPSLQVREETLTFSQIGASPGLGLSEQKSREGRADGCVDLAGAAWRPGEWCPCSWAPSSLGRAPWRPSWSSCEGRPRPSRRPSPTGHRGLPGPARDQCNPTIKMLEKLTPLPSRAAHWDVCSFSASGATVRGTPWCPGAPQRITAPEWLGTAGVIHA